MRILVAEDDRTTRLLLTRALSSWGYDVLAVPNGEEAWAALSREKIRMLVSDWEMPLLEGPALCRRLREGSLAYVYALLLTTHKDPARLVEGLDAGADDFVTKPFNPAELRARLGVGRRVLGLQDDLAAKFEELERANAQLARIAGTDPLMNIGNRRSFEEAIAMASEQVAREKGSYGVLMIDVDHFKKVNDRYGHATGDRVLSAVANALTTAKGPADQVFRYGGEEIVLVSPDQTASGLAALGERLRLAIAALRVEREGSVLGVTASFGAALADGGEIPWGTLVERADRALYASKEAGRDRVTLFSGSQGPAATSPASPGDPSHS
jgi:two-component system cell cycle response regulator